MKKIRLAVTGLRQAGKTVFLTSLINYLLGNGPKNSPIFRKHGISLGTKELPLDGSVPRFSYEEYLEGYKHTPPCWPQRTKQLSEFHIHLWLRHRRRRTKEYRLELVDYPGEQIIDLPLGKKSYPDWSDEILIDAAVGIRRQLSLDFRQTCEQLTQASPQDTQVKNQILEKYRLYLLDCKENGLHYIQPSSLLLELHPPAPMPAFCPLPQNIRASAPTLAAQFAAQYDVYKTEHLKNFAQQVTRCSQQIVLVDILNILKSGPAVFNDVRKCFDSILDVYRYKKNYRWLIDLLAGLFLFRVNIDRVSFVATKADQATRTNRNNLKALLEELVCGKHEYLKYDTAARSGFFFAAANRSTQDKIKEYNGRELSVLMGRHAQNAPDEERLYYPGEVPPEWPEQWDPDQKAYRFPNFLPCSLPGRDGAIFDHINLDEILWGMFEDHKS